MACFKVRMLSELTHATQSTMLTVCLFLEILLMFYLIFFSKNNTHGLQDVASDRTIAQYHTIPSIHYL